MRKATRGGVGDIEDLPRNLKRFSVKAQERR